MAEKVILVTGGGGFVGSHCLLDILNAGYKVVAIDNFSNSYGTPEGQSGAILRVEEMTGKKVDFIKADLINKEELRSVFKKYPNIDCVIHFAAYKAVAESFQRVMDYYSNNLIGTINLLAVMEEFKVYSLVFSSSCTVYGNPEYLPIDEKHKLGTTTNPYGQTKQTAERMMMDLSVSNPKWRFSFLRYFNPAGAHPSGNIGEDPLGVPNNLMPFLAQVAIGRREKISVFGNDFKTRDGTGIRDYIHVMDIADGHVRALAHLLEKDRQGVYTFNLASGKGSTVLEVVEAFGRACGKEIPYVFAARRPGDVDALYASFDKAEKELGWKVTKTLDDMCRDMWTWQTKNPTGYAPN